MGLFEKYGEMGWKILIFFGVVANLWLTSNFVTQAEMTAFKTENLKDHLASQATLVELTTTLKVMNVNGALIADHENRIRALEARQVDMQARLGQLEKHATP